MITFVTVLPAVADVRSFVRHGYAIRAGLAKLVNISTALVDVYSKCGSVERVRLNFDGMDQRTVVSWNSMIVEYVQSGEPEMAVAGGRDRDKLSNVILVEALHAYADLGDRKREKFVDKLNLGCDVSVMNSWISLI